ncbi:vitamin B12 transporter [Thiogranum longum]|uniref:Vitamin B12 transporter n=1 Tax=Thiogranum longum TaxID=1537524 RepID=A0A4R1HB37_9GAMM|nr:TonB-dependent receptor [Thiogranum longum]TCK19167.1 vitamin B12 transporter [Thiogranum longum]
MSGIEQSVSTPLSCAASALMLFALFPSSQPVAAETVNGDTVVVTATRTAQTANEALASVQVIHRAEIERAQANDVAELLRFLAGVDIGRSGGPGQQTSVFIRGAESNHTLLLIDGVKVNDATVGSAAWQNIDPAMIERIEVVRGPRSSLYGSEAIGGVIQIFTRKPTAGVSQSGSFGVGTNNTVRGDARVAGTGDKFRASAGLSFQGTDGYQTLISATGDRGYSNMSLDFDFGADLGAVDMAFSTWASKGKTEYYDFFAAPLDQDYSNRVTAVTLSANPADIWSSTLRLSYTADRLEQNQSSDLSATARWAADWQNDVQIGEAQLLTVGAYLANENVDSASFGTVVKEDKNIRAVFGQDQIVLGNTSLLLAARYTDDEIFGNETTWNTTLGYRFTDSTSVYASVGTGFKAPSFFDLFGFGGNAGLDPEKSTNYEMGVKHHIDTGQQISVTAFQNEIDDLISFVDPDGFLGPVPGQNVNVDEARIRGVEVEYRYAMGDWSGHVSATYQDPEDRNTGEQLARRAKKSFSATLDYRLGPWQIGGQFLTTGEREDSAFSNTVLGGYSVLDLNVSKLINRNLTVRGRLENAFDKDYQTAGGFKTQGRAVYLNVVFSSEGI